MVVHNSVNVNYVCGLLFSADRKRLVLLKSMPDEVSTGRWDAPRDRLKPGEHQHQAVSRAFLEKTGVMIEVWEPFMSLTDKGCLVWYYRAFSDKDIMRVKSLTAEPLGVVGLTDAGLAKIVGLAPSLRWIVPMALEGRKEQYTVES